MCTVSWSRDHQGYALFFNRDELNLRAPEQSPAPAWLEDTAYLAPRDGDQGGTWLLVNEFGLTVCLLNDYGNPWRPAETSPRFSRGHVVLACAAATDFNRVVAVVRAQPLAQTPPFHLCMISPAEGPRLLHWNGAGLIRHDQPPLPPVRSSSSFSPAEVIAARLARFRDCVRSPAQPETGELAAYHREHQPGAGAHSVLMRRSDAATRSIIQVRITADQVQLDYQPVSWSSQGPELPTPTRTMLPRR